MATVGQRFKTGNVCETSGSYVFDGYENGSTAPSPTAEERVIPLSKGETFPPIRSAKKSAWWKLQRIT
ncbi:YjzC family protein [Corallococcus exercitus]|uniref:YjzC family protein n=1 Tax=Corallococcus exercitus TaxID=2316736 RepID=A0A7Y4JWQ0_9BACT|nr:YjzC family protein [Corallococcus exercitus]NOK12583.1 YjzC family protein [Corallococcus exercitus]